MGRCRARSALVAVGLSLLAGACDTARPRAPEGAGPGELKGGTGDPSQVVAEVGDQVVTLEEVQAVVDAAGLPPRKALSKLVVERLLAAEAHRRGYGDDPNVQRAERRAAVHALLEAAVEQPVGPDDLPDDEVAQRLEEALQKQAVPERRRADHILFRAGEETDAPRRALAREAAQRALAELRQGPVDEVLQRYETQGADHARVVAKVERLPPMGPSARLAEPFRKALFAAEAPGALGEVVETRFGFHAVVLREIVPPSEPDAAALEAEVRAKMVVERRRARVEALLAQARERSTVEYHEQVVASALAESSGDGSP